MGTAYLLLSLLYAIFVFGMCAFGIFAIGNIFEIAHRKIKSRLISKQ